jgi:hypothetical protein
MFHELQAWWETWWPSQTAETRALIQQGGVALAALVGGYFLGSMVARWLRRCDFDAVLRLSEPPPGPDGKHRFTPAFVGGMLVRLSVWAAAGSWIARQHGQVELANTLGLIVSRSWAVAGVLVGSLALAGLVVRRLVHCLQGLPSMGPVAAAASGNGAAGSPRGLAGAIGVTVYGVILLLALLVTADWFNWPLTRSSAQALWQFAQHVLVAAAALAIGGLGARWARDLGTAEGAASPEKQAGQYTALGIVAASTVLAVAVLLSSASLLYGLVALALLGGGLWLVRRHLPDIAAGLQLRAHKVREVHLEGVPCQVAEVGLVTSQVCRAGQINRVQNRLLLAARFNGAPAATGR